jgi:hypothetical protein
MDIDVILLIGQHGRKGKFSWETGIYWFLTTLLIFQGAANHSPFVPLGSALEVVTVVVVVTLVVVVFVIVGFPPSNPPSNPLSSFGMTELRVCQRYYSTSVDPNEDVPASWDATADNRHKRVKVTDLKSMLRLRVCKVSDWMIRKDGIKI